MNNITETQRNLWIETYIQETHKDPHIVFAIKLGIGRQAAKVLCYKIIYTIPFLESLVNASYSTAQAEHGIRGNY